MEKGKGDAKRFSQKERAKKMRQEAYRRMKALKKARDEEAKQKRLELLAAGVEVPPTPDELRKEAQRKRAKEARQAAYRKAKERKKAQVQRRQTEKTAAHDEALWAEIKTGGDLEFESETYSEKP